MEHVNHADNKGNSPPASITQLMRKNEIPVNASIFERGRDPHSTTNRYHSVDDIKIIKTFNQQEWVVVNYRQVNPQKESKRRYRPYMAVYNNLTSHTVDKEGKVAIIQVGSKDGSVPFSLYLGISRETNSHPIIFNTEGFKAVILKHNGALASIDNLYEWAVEEATKRAQEIPKKVRAMRKVELSMTEALQIAKKAAELRFLDESIKVDPTNLLREREAGDEGMDLWRVVCRVHKNLIEAGKLQVVNANGQARKARELEHIGRELKVNAGLFELAEQHLNKVN